jgi:ribose-phosphate pyrophosphokinase
MACITHPVFADTVFEKMENSDISALAVTNTIHQDPAAVRAKTSRIQILSVARILGEAIHRIHREESLSSLFI